MKVSLLNAFIAFFILSVLVGVGIKIWKSYQPVVINNVTYWRYEQPANTQCPACGGRWRIELSPFVSKGPEGPAYIPLTCSQCTYKWRMLTKSVEE